MEHSKNKEFVDVKDEKQNIIILIFYFENSVII